MRTLFFDIIADSRFVSDPASESVRLKREILKALNALPGVHTAHGEVEKYTARASSGEENEQYICRVHVRKEGRKTTWDDIYRAVNSVKPAIYRFTEFFDWESADKAKGGQ